MRLGVLATRNVYQGHIRPIWDALEPEERGVSLDDARKIDRRDADVWLSASARDFRAGNSRLRQARRVVMEHGVGLQFYSRHEARMLAGAAVIAAPNAFVARFFASTGHRRIAIVGTPRMDAYADIPSPTAGIVAASFHWTGGREVMDSYAPALRRLAAEHEVIGHSHPRLWNAAERFYEQLGIEAVCDFDEVIRRASVYCCDHSSTIFEFAALDRPVVLLDRPEGRQRVPQASGLGYDLHAHLGAHVGVAGLSDAVEVALAGDEAHAPARERMRRDLYPHLSSSTRRMVELLRETANGSTHPDRDA